MIQRNFKGLVIVGILLSVGITNMMAEAIIYNQQADPVVFNKDITNMKQRPFIVDKKEYPFKSNWFKKDGVSMHYIDEGAGIPIVLTHGNPDWSFLNRKIIKGMSKYARVIAFDLPGFGFSDTPKNYSFTPQEHVKWVKALLHEHLKLDKFILVVQDWGGPIGLSVATDNPDKILGLVISNTWAWPAKGKLKEFSEMMKTPKMEKLMIENNYFATTILPSVLNETTKNNKAILDAYKMPFPTPKSRKGTLVFPQAITDAAPWLEQLEAKLPTLAHKPVEFIFGAKDPWFGTAKNIAKWRSFYPNGNLQLIADANHFSQEDSPESFVFALKRILKELKTKE
ncbi:alpha/beta fold hydrolase [Sulfurospirillum sp. 1612]|uniref:alpha/beta fold hydrolase n=1 Tax=Sulfurospirillum sp. 1612 TaxID=3094835 RepID=UPI002F9270BC